MNLLDPKIRFDELCAGRAMGDLCQEEERELAQLGRELRLSPDLSFELIAASIELDFMANFVQPLPVALISRLHRSAEEKEKAPAIIRPAVGQWRKIVCNPFVGWAAAAAITLFAVFGSQPTPQVLPAQALAKLRAEATDLLAQDFAGVGNYKNASGKVHWSDDLQQGYMTLSGIPVNDPKKSQYQLWIVDPKRDEAPIDGGVFDIPTDGSPVVVPIIAKLELSHPQAFVITLEQAGGVVKSKQEHVVALAKS